MKKFKVLIILMVILGILSGCGSVQNPETPEKNPEETASEKTSVYTDVYEVYTVQYEEALKTIYEFIKNIDAKSGPGKLPEGIWEAALATGDDALDSIGYTFRDLDGDEMCELLVGAFDKPEDAYTKNEVYAIYTLDENVPKIVLEGMSRSAYSLTEAGELFYQGSNGAAYSIFGKYYLKNSEIVCDDYYFTYPDDEQNMEIYHNKTGAWDKENSQKLDMTFDEYTELQDEWAKTTTTVEARPFSELDPEIAEKALLKAKAPNPALLDGEWVLVGGETDGMEFTAEEEGLKSEIVIKDNTVEYYMSTEYNTERFSAEIEFFEEPLYYECTNDIWCAEFVITEGDFGTDEKFCATLTEENTLLLQHMFPFDGTQGVSYQYYTRK